MKNIKEVLDIAKLAQTRNCDSVFAVVGRERIGKSTLMLNAIEYLGGDASCIAVDKEEFGKVFCELKDAGIFSFDEAGDGLFSRDSLSKFNKDLVKMFMIVGAKRVIAFLVLPDFFLLDSYFRKHRIVGLFHVYKRGKCAFYGRNEIKKINIYHDKYRSHDIRGARPRFTDSFPDYKGAFLEDYLKKKQAKIEATIESMRSKPKEQKKESMRSKPKEQKKKRIPREEIYSEEHRTKKPLGYVYLHE